MKCKSCISAVLTATMALPMLLTLGGCFVEHHDDRDGREDISVRHVEVDVEHHDDHRDEHHDDDHR